MIKFLRLTAIMLCILLSGSTVFAQSSPVLKLSKSEIGVAPYQLTDEDAAKVFALTDLTIAVKVVTPVSMSGRKAIFCTSDPTQAANSDAKKTNSAYVAYGSLNNGVSYLASCRDKDRFSDDKNDIANKEVVLTYVLSHTNNNIKIFIDGTSVMDRNFGDYEIATPKMVKEDHAGAQIYIGGGKTAEGARELFDGIITGVEVYDGVLSNEEIAKLFQKELTLKQNILAQIKETNELVSKVASVEFPVYGEQLALQVGDANKDFYIWTNAQEKTEGPIANLVDGSTNNFFHTQWNEGGASSDGLPHYIEVDLGESNKLSTFRFTYTTRADVEHDYPQRMVIYGSNDKSSYYEIDVISNGMPKTKQQSSYTSPLIVSDVEYRYLRFMVTNTNKDRKTDNASQHNYWHMAEFDIEPATIEATVKTEYAQYVTPATVAAAYKVSYITAKCMESFPGDLSEMERWNTALEEKYAALKSEYDNQISANKNLLQALIEQIKELLNTISEKEYLKLQNDDPNAAYYVSSNAGHNTEDGNASGYVDGAGIAGLFDNTADTYFHSRWGGNDVGEPHYLQIDLGEDAEISNFVFEYAPRNGNSPAPTAIEVRIGAGLDAIGDAEPIARYNEENDNLPAYTSGGKEWFSNLLSPSENYRYIRLTVTGSKGPGTIQYGGQYFFGMGTLRLATYKVKSGYSSYIALQKLEELICNIDESKNLILDAATTLEEILQKYNELEDAYNSIVKAISPAFPVELTTDVSNPVVYNIIIARTNHYNPSALQFDLSTGKVAVKQQNKNNLFQGWYFMLGNEGKVKIYPYLGEGKLLGTNDNENGKGKVLAIDESADGYGYEWNITKLDEDWCNISISIGSTFNYFSHYGGGVDDMMGFYSENNTSDAGSRFKFEKLENIGYNAVTEVEIKKNTGTGLAVGGWKNSWTSNAVDGITAPVVLGVTANYITIKNDDDYLRLYVGQDSPSTYTITPAAGYYIESYSFKFVKDGEYDGNVNLIADGKTYNATAEEQIVESTVPLLEPYSNNTAEFKMSGSNNGIKVYDFIVKIRPILTTFVTYNYVLNGTVLGSEKLECAVGCNYPAPKLFPVKAPEGCVVGLETVNVNCVAEIELGTSLTDVWNVGLWKELNQIPAGITENVKLPGDETIASAHYMTLGVDVKSAGYLQVNFNNHKDGNNRLDIIGVDLLNSNGEVVVSDYHFGYKGTHNEKNIYSLNVANAGVYTLRYIVSFQKEENSSIGEIAVNLYNRLTAESGFNYNWNPDLWIGLDNIPEYIKKNVTVQNGTLVTRDVKYVENYIYAEAGILEATFIYKGGNNRLDIVGVDLFDVYGNAIESSNDYHFGYSGNAKVGNTYSFLVAKSGFYKLRYIVCHISEALTSNGEVNNVLYNAYNKFKSVWDRTEEICTNNVSGTVGHYTDASMNKLYELYEVYKDYSPETSVADLFTAKAELENALAALKINMPQKDNFYAFVSASTQNYCSGKYVHTNVGAVERQGNGQKVVYNHTHLLFDAYEEIVNKSLTMFTFTPVEGSDNKFKVKNLHTGMYVKSFGGTHMGSAEEANNVTIESYSYPKVVLTTGSYYMHAQQTGGEVVVWNKDSEASLWKIVGVDPSIANYTASIGNARWSTLCLNYAVTVPEGVTAYAATGVAGNEITLESVGKVIPAGTPVLLNLNEGVETGKFTFEYVNETPASISDNKLQGTFYDSYIEYDGGHEYYVLAQINGKVGFAKIKRDYNGEGSKVGQDNGGTHFKNNANRVYLPIVKDLNPVQSYGVRIVDGTTGIDTIVTDGVAPEAIYDLSGRRVKEMTLPGIYIVNGKKYIKK